MRNAKRLCAWLPVLAIALTIALPARAATSRPAAAPARGGAPPADTSLTFPRFFDSMLALAPDSARVASVASLQITRDAGVFVLEHGTLALCTPVAGAVHAAVFEGRGTFLFTPPAGLERDQLERTFGRRLLRRDFTTLVMLFSDTTLAEFTQVATFGSGPIPKPMRDALHDVLPFVVSSDLHAVAPRVAKPLLDPVGDGLFLAAIGGADLPLYFAIDPQRTERVELLRQPDNDRQGMLIRHGLEIVSRFRAASDVTAPRDTAAHDAVARDSTARDSVATDSVRIAPAPLTPALDSSAVEGDVRLPVHVRHAALKVNLSTDLEMHVTATLDLEANRDRQHWLPFQIPPTALIESASWEGGGEAPHWTWKGNPVMWVRCDPPLEAGKVRTLTIVYRARALDRASDMIENQLALGWYPWLDPRDRATFELAFQVPLHDQLAASGVNESAVTRNGLAISHWTVDPPAPLATFELGPFRRLEIDPDSLPHLSVLLLDPHHAGESERLNLAEHGTRTSDQRVAAEVADEALFFRRAFGPLAAHPLTAVEGAENGVLHSPQLVRLPMVFESKPDPAVPEQFYRAREMARQWWGVGAWAAGSRDAWLCEGLANFSAAWFAQNDAPGTAGYLGLLESWRQQLVEQRAALYGRNVPPSPLSMGARLDESAGGWAATSTADHDHLVRQAAWTIHMLRGLMLGPDDPEERRFAGLLREFCAAHRGRAFTTQEFRAAAERALGRDLGWFFDQWVDHAAIPTYTFSYRVDRAGDGRYVVHGRVRQTHVPSTFRMAVPVRIESAAGAPTRLRVEVQGPLTEFELPAMADKPDRVVFNDLNAVLCEVVEAPWE